MSIGQMLEKSAVRFPSRTALIFDKESLKNSVRDGMAFSEATKKHPKVQEQSSYPLISFSNPTR
ncbi:MAG: hypothetical protein HYY56_06100 [Candidatus Omnitrophica bacterium]|nr:hypothetical protein [Candidatus Omnitrophota bacterium]